MADVSLDDLIKKDKEQFKANRANKVLLSLSRNSISLNIKKDSKTMINNIEAIDNKSTKISLVLSRKNSLKNLKTIKIISDKIESKNGIDRIIDLPGNKGHKNKKTTIKKIYLERSKLWA